MLRDHGTISGAALLHYRFSFTSSWFALSAALESGDLIGRMSATANGLAMTLATVHFASALERVGKGDASAPAWYLAGAYPVVFYRALLDTEVVSPSPNLPAAMSIVLAGWLLLLDDPGRTKRRAITLLAGAECLKLTTLPAGLIALLWRPRRARDFTWLIPLALGAVPLLSANYRASGCPLFPSGPCVDTPHTLNPVKQRAVLEETWSWARSGEIVSHPKFTDMRWIPSWLRRSDKVLLSVLLVAAAVLGAFRRWTATVAMAAGGCLFVLLTVPDLRFCYGYIAALAGSALAAVCTSRRPLVRWSTLAFCCLALVAWSAYGWVRSSFAKQSPFAPWQTRIYRPAPLPPVTWGTAIVGLIEYRGPFAGDRCWDVAFPCTPYLVPKDLQLCRPENGLGGGICQSTSTLNRLSGGEPR